MQSTGFVLSGEDDASRGEKSLESNTSHFGRAGHIIGHALAKKHQHHRPGSDGSMDRHVLMTDASRDGLYSDVVDVADDESVDLLEPLEDLLPQWKRILEDGLFAPSRKMTGNGKLGASAAGGGPGSGREDRSSKSRTRRFVDPMVMRGAAAAVAKPVTGTGAASDDAWARAAAALAYRVTETPSDEMTFRMDAMATLGEVPGKDSARAPTEVATPREATALGAGLGVSLSASLGPASLKKNLSLGAGIAANEGRGANTSASGNDGLGRGGEEPSATLATAPGSEAAASSGTGLGTETHTTTGAARMQSAPSTAISVSAMVPAAGTGTAARTAAGAIGTSASTAGNASSLFPPESSSSALRGNLALHKIAGIGPTQGLGIEYFDGSKDLAKLNRARTRAYARLMIMSESFVSETMRRSAEDLNDAVQDRLAAAAADFPSEGTSVDFRGSMSGSTGFDSVSHHHRSMHHHHHHNLHHQGQLHHHHQAHHSSSQLHLGSRASNTLAEKNARTLSDECTRAVNATLGAGHPHAKKTVETLFRLCLVPLENRFYSELISASEARKLAEKLCPAASHLFGDGEQDARSVKSDRSMLSAHLYGTQQGTTHHHAGNNDGNRKVEPRKIVFTPQVTPSSVHNH